MKDCIFCKIIHNKISTDRVFENQNVVAFNDIEPKAPIHILIIPKKHINSIGDLNHNDKALMGEMIYAAKEISEKINIKESGFRCIFNTNNDGGQTVFHIHMHLMAGRKLNWPPG